MHAGLEESQPDANPQDRVNQQPPHSSPTTKKKSVIRPSLIQWSSDSFSSKPPKTRPTGVCQIEWYAADQGEFASTRATTVQVRSTMPLADSTCRNRTKGRSH